MNGYRNICRDLQNVSFSTAHRTPIKHPFFRIVSRTINKPPVYLVQTDGSFRAHNQSSTAVLAFTKPKLQQIRHYDEHFNSYESKWASVLDGVRFSAAHDFGGIELENDNAAVITLLKERRPPAQDYVQHYYDEILREAAHLDWFAVRWIPRELNRADKLFH